MVTYGSTVSFSQSSSKFIPGQGHAGHFTANEPAGTGSSPAGVSLKSRGDWSRRRFRSFK